MAEIDETEAALKKSTLTVIDERGPTDTAALQLSDFSLLEDRKTNELEIYLTRYGERPGNIRSADVHKFTFNLPD